MNQWYKELKVAPWNPPSYVFGIVWPILYLLMFISLIIVWTDKKCYPYCTAITYFIIQLFFNLIWTTLFFRLRMPLLALLDLSIIVVLMLLALIEFYKLNTFVFWLNIPYTVWLIFAWYLNVYIWLNN